jgi:hypothetical protein
VDTSNIAAPRRLDLDGNFEPEAFSSDDRHLYVLEYLPREAPDRYRVRQVHLASGRVEVLVDRWKHVPLASEETMRGTGRQQVLSPDSKVLYTLYTHQPDHLHGRDIAAGVTTARGNVHAFVHTLNLEQGWAFCVDLPAPFGVGPAEAHALALSPDGHRLIVADRTSGSMAAVDTESLEIRLNVPGTPDPHAAEGQAAAQFSPDGRTLYVAAGSEVSSFDPRTLARQHRFELASSVTGLRVGPHAQRLYVSLDERVLALDAATGRELTSIAVPGLRTLRG